MTQVLTDIYSLFEFNSIYNLEFETHNPEVYRSCFPIIENLITL